MIDAKIAANRFGLGARPGAADARDPKRALLAQLDRFDARPAALAAVPTRAALASELSEYLQELRGLLAGGGRPNMAAAMSGMMPGSMAGGDDAAGEKLNQTLRRYVRKSGRDSYATMVGARVQAALDTPAPFVERLVHFWANHFAVSADKLTVISMAGLLEFEAIRPHVLGTFSEMLIAVEQHPAMLLYLDQAQSVGPASMIGATVAKRGKRKVGLNENLAREILELHTLGVRTGYGQNDVTEFARALTGWTVAGLTRGPIARFAGTDGEAGDFVFAERLHEPGARRILGRSYAPGGAGQARAVLADLAGHPATAAHIATKLARHFAGDTPPPALVARLTASFQTTGGDLPSLYRVLIDAPELWTATPAKFKSPWDWSVSALRTVGSRQVEAQAAAGLLIQLGQPVWRPGSPAGFDDIDASWAGPDALMRRVEAASRIATRAGNAVDARSVAAAVLPGGGSAATLQAIARAESPSEGLALMLVAPEFMRR